MRAEFRPPYQLSLSYAVLFYAVDGACLERLVAPGFRPLVWVGKSLLMILLASYREAESVATGARGEPYREVAYATPGRGRVSSGLHAFRLHVTDATARDIGRDQYGFPKELAEISLDADLRAVASQKYGSLLLDLEMRRRDDFVGRLQALAMRCLAGRVPLLGRFLQDHGGQLVRSRLCQRTGRVDALRVARASVPELERMGLLSPRQAVRPLLAGWVADARFRLEAPAPS